MAVTIKCSAHPRYKAVRPPPIDCEQCQLIYGTVQDLKGYWQYAAEGK